MQTGHTKGQQQERRANCQQPQQTQPQNHQVHREFEAQGPQRPVDFKPNGVVDEGDAR